MSFWTPVTMWRVSSCSESLRLSEWCVENTASVQGLPSEQDPVGSRFSGSLCSRSSYGTSPNMWVLKKLINFKQTTQHAWPCPVEYFWKIFTVPPFNLFRNLGDVLLRNCWIKYVVQLTFPCIFMCFSRTAANSLLFLKTAMILREKFSQLGRLIWILIL